MRRLRRGIATLAVGGALLLVPDSQAASTLFSLVEVEESTGVDFGDDDVVVVLALGSDSEGNADAIELIALNFETGQAAAVGIPRDTVVEFDGEPSKINDGLPRGGAQLMADAVADLTDVRPQFVLTTGSAGFRALVDSVGELRVTSDFTIDDEKYGLHVTPGINPMNGLQATGFAGTREVPGNDFGRMANQQHLLEAILDKIRAQEDTEGFIESGALAALEHLDTGLSPSELYRFAQAISQVDPAQTTTCVLTGPSVPLGVNVGIELAPGYPERVAADAVDGHLDGGCNP